MAVSLAREDKVTDPAAYADRQDVLAMLHGVAIDVEGDTLEAWASSTNIASAIDRWLVTTRKQIDGWAGIDFVLHENVSVSVDGTGGQFLPLGQYGFRPLLDMTALTIGTSVEDVTDYEVDEWIGLLRPAKNLQGYAIFSRGNQNVDLTLTWGYHSAPEDIVAANAMLAAARLLPLVAASDIAQPGALGGIQTVEFGEMRIRHYEQGRYSPLIKQYTEEAQRIALGYKIPRVSQGKPMVYEGGRATRWHQFFSKV